MARTYFSAVSAGESSSASTTYTDKIALTITAAQQAPSTDYYVLWSAMLGNITSLTEDMKIRLFNDTAAAVMEESNIEQTDSTDYIQIGGCKKWTSAASPVDQTFSIEFACETNDTILIKEARIVAIKKETGDEYAESNGDSTTTLSTFQDKTTLSFTPSTPGDYQFVQSLTLSTASVTGVTCESALHDGSTQQRTTGLFQKDSTNFKRISHIYKGTNLSGAQTWKNQYRSNGTVTVTIRQSSLLALRLSTFDGTPQYAESNAVSSTASASYQDKTTVSFTPEALAHLVLTGSNFGNATTTVSTFMRTSKAGAALQAESLKETGALATVAPLNNNSFQIHLETLTAAATTWISQWHQESGATNATIEQSAIAVLQLQASIVAPSTKDWYKQEKATPMLPPVRGYARSMLTLPYPEISRTVDNPIYPFLKSELRREFPRNKITTFDVFLPPVVAPSASDWYTLASLRQQSLPPRGNASINFIPGFQPVEPSPQDWYLQATLRGNVQVPRGRIADFYTPIVFEVVQVYVDWFNLEVLKSPAQARAGKIKLLYVDPPFAPPAGFGTADWYDLGVVRPVLAPVRGRYSQTFVQPPGLNPWQGSGVGTGVWTGQGALAGGWLGEGAVAGSWTPENAQTPNWTKESSAGNTWTKEDEI